MAFVDPFKPRAFATGALFVGLLAVEGLTAVSDDAVVNHAIEGGGRFNKLVPIAVTVVFCYFAGLTATVYLGARGAGAPPASWGESWWVMAATLCALVGALFTKSATTLPAARASFGVMVIAALVAGVGHAYLKLPHMSISLWFVVVGIYSFSQPWRRDWAEGGQLVSFAWQSVALITWFAASVYPAISPAWGGGAAVRATITIVDEGQAERVEPVEIIDETAYGFYLRAEGGRGTLFVPRELVKSVLITPPRP